MKKYIQRAIVFLLTFLFGVFFTWIFLSFMFSFDASIALCNHNCVIPRMRSILHFPATENVKVNFKGFKEGEYGRDAHFEIVNQGSQAIYYSSYERTVYAGGSLKVDGNEIRQTLRCGTGLNTYHLHPGDSVMSAYSESALQEHPTGTNFQVGYFFEIADGQIYETYWSESFRLPENK